MKKLLLLFMTILAFGCSTSEVIETETTENSFRGKPAFKGKWTNTICDNVIVPEEAVKSKIAEFIEYGYSRTNHCETYSYGVYVYCVQDNSTVKGSSLLVVNLPTNDREPCFNHDFDSLTYRVTVYKDGEVFTTGCVTNGTNLGSRIGYLRFQRKPIKDGVYTVLFDDYGVIRNMQLTYE